MSKKIFKDLFKFCFTCSVVFISLSARTGSADAKEASVSNIEDMQEMLREAGSEASEEEPYIISVEAGSYKLKSSIQVPDYTTLRLDKEAYIECKNTDEFAIRIRNGRNAAVEGGSFNGAGILVNGGDNISITDTVIENPPYGGIVFKGINNGCSISGNTVNNSKKFSITLLGAKFKGNIEKNTITKSAEIAIYIYNSTLKGDIANNNIKNCKATGIYAGLSPLNGDIRENTIKNVKGNGIGIYHGSHVNAIDGNLLDGIGGRDSGFNGNTAISLNADEGPGKKAFKTYAKKIVNNTIKNVTYSGIALYSGPSGGKESSANQDKAFIKENIEGNKLYNIGTYKHSKNWKKEIAKGGKIGAHVGIYVDTHARVYGDICKNEIIKSSQHGIYLRVGSVVKNIYSNTIKNVTEDGISVSSSKVTGSIYNNKITNAKRAGLYVRENSVINKVSGNTFKQIGFKSVAVVPSGKIKNNKQK